jgi:hypothetical protein
MTAANRVAPSKSPTVLTRSYGLRNQRQRWSGCAAPGVGYPSGCRTGAVVGPDSTVAVAVLDRKLLRHCGTDRNGLAGRQPSAC